MKKLFAIIGIAVIAVAIASSPAHARIRHTHSHCHNNDNSSSKQQQHVNQSDVDAIGKVNADLEAFTRTYTKQDLQQSELLTALTELQVSLKSLEDHAFSLKLGNGYTQAANELKTKTGKLREIVDNGISVLTGGDVTARKKASEEFPKQFNTAIDEYNAAIKNLDKATEEANKKQSIEAGLPYLIILILSVLLAIAMFIWAFAKQVSPIQLRKARRMVALATLVPLAGAAITYITFLIASQQQNGGTFTIMTGLMIFGLVVFVRALINYHKLKKTIATTPTDAPTPPVA